jgi:hypothetical protein
MSERKRESRAQKSNIPGPVMRVSGWVGAVAYHKAASSVSQHVTDLLLRECAISGGIDTQISCLKHIL